MFFNTNRCAADTDPVRSSRLCFRLGTYRWQLLYQHQLDDGGTGNFHLHLYSFDAIQSFLHQYYFVYFYY